MSKIEQKQNIEAHYSTSAKVAKPQRVVVEGPNNIPKHHTYTDREANIKLESLNNDVYESVKKTSKKNKRKKFLGII